MSLAAGTCGLRRLVPELRPSRGGAATPRRRTRRAPAVIPDDQDCWDEHRFEHSFALRSNGLPAVELRAAEYPGGRLDWSAVDSFAGTLAAEAAPIRLTQKGIPAPARFGGMPAARFWEMEDARFDPGSVDAAPIDLGL